MDYFQGTVETYLRADRSLFLNSEYCLQLDHVAVPKKDRHWYVDVVAIDFKNKIVWLCEISYAKNLAALLKRLQAWQNNWPDVSNAIIRDSFLPQGFTAKPWVFIPDELNDLFKKKFVGVDGTDAMPEPKITSLEEVLPWKYTVWAKHDQDIVVE